MSRLKMFTPERCGMLVLAVCLLAVCLLAIGRGCPRGDDAAKDAPDAAAVADSMTAAEPDSAAAALKRTGKPKKSSKPKKARKDAGGSAPVPYTRSPLDESAQ